jgi:hypothetical protein
MFRPSKLNQQARTAQIAPKLAIPGTPLIASGGQDKHRFSGARG